MGSYVSDLVREEPTVSFSLEYLSDSPKYLFLPQDQMSRIVVYLFISFVRLHFSTVSARTIKEQKCNDLCYYASASSCSFASATHYLCLFASGS